jgi:hydroxymethylglutaryl-CoA lyase
MLHSMGIETGLSLDDLIAASHTLAKIVEHETPSYISKAGPFNRKYPIPVS